MPALPRPSPEARSGGSRTGRGSHMRGGWRGGRSLRSPGRTGGCDGDRRRQELSPHSRFPASQFPQPGGRGGVAVTLETSTLPACGHFRILYAYVTSFFLPFTFFGASPVESRATLVPSGFSVGFYFFLCFILFCLLSLTRACRGFFLERPVVGIAPNGGSRIAVRGTDLCAAPQGPFRPWQAWCTISMLV